MTSVERHDRRSVVIETGATSVERQDRRSMVIGTGVALLAIAAMLQFLPGAIRAVDSWPLYAQTHLTGPGDLWDVLTEPVRDGPADSPLPYWRPVSLLTYSIEQLIGGPYASVAHGVNLLLHAAVAVLTFGFVRRMLNRLPVAALAGAVVALAPIAIESVPAPARRHDLLATLFALLAVTAALRAPSRSTAVWVTVFGVFAAASKETGAVVLVPVAILTLGLHGVNRHTVRRLVALGCGLTLYALIRIPMISSAGPAPSGGAPLGLRDAVTSTAGAVAAPGPLHLWALTVGAVVATAVIVMTGLTDRTNPAQRWRPAALCLVAGGAWLLAGVVTLGLAGKGTEPMWRTLYQLVPPFAIALAGSVVLVLSITSQAARNVAAGTVGLLIVLTVAGTLTASPLLHRYREWKIASDVTELHLQALDGASSADRLLAARVVVRVLPDHDLHVRTASVVGAMSLRGYAVRKGYDVEVVTSARPIASRCHVVTGDGVDVSTSAGENSTRLVASGGGGNCTDDN